MLDNESPDVIPEAPTDTLAPEPPVREASGAAPLPQELESRLKRIESQDVSPSGQLAA